MKAPSFLNCHTYDRQNIHRVFFCMSGNYKSVFHRNKDVKNTQNIAISEDVKLRKSVIELVKYTKNL